MPHGAKVHQLEDLIVEEVSIVDRPANKRRFLTVKNEGGEMRGSEIVVDENGNLVTVTPEGPGEEDTPSIGEVFGKLHETMATVEKRLSIPLEMRTDLFRSLGEVMQRLNSVMGAADSAAPDRGEGGSKLLPVLGSELGEIAKLLGDIAKRVNGAGAGVEKAEDKAEFVEGGFNAKIRNAKGDLDPALIKAALSALEKVNIPDAAKKKAAAALEKLLEQANKAKFTKDDGSEMEPAERALLELVEEVEKRGAKMSKSRLERFKQALEMLGKLLGELDVEQKADVTRKAQEAVVSKSIDSLTANVERLVAVVKRQGKEIRTLREARPGSNVIPVEKGAPDKSEADEEVSWPLDMNDPKTRDQVDKATSFYDS